MPQKIPMTPHLFEPLVNCDMARSQKSTALQEQKQTKRQRVAFSPLIWIGCIVLIFLLATALIAPFFSSSTYYSMNLAQKNLPPSAQFWFGTDELGRDLFIRVCYGGRISFLVGSIAAGIDAIIGVLWGSIAAFGSRWLDELLMRVADILYAIPYMLIVILLKLVFGSGILPIALALALTNWINMARIARANILQIKQQEYVLASIALGARFWHIIFRHLIPNASNSIVIAMMLSVSSAIFTEAFLSFLGLGLQAPIASWGTLTSEGLSALAYYPWRFYFPAASILLTLWALNLVGEGLRNALDPYLKK